MVEVAPAGVPEREAPPSPPLFDEPEDDGVRAFTLELHGHLEQKYAELHRLNDLEDLVRPVLAAGWSPEELRDEILSRLPRVRHRCNRAPHRAIGYLLSDLKGEAPGAAPASSTPRAPEQPARPRAQGDGPTPPPSGMEHLPAKPKSFTWDYWAGIHGIDVPPGEALYV